MHDIVLMMTDGVTEFRSKLELDAREIIKSIIYPIKHLTAQEICEHLYKKLELCM